MDVKMAAGGGRTEKRENRNVKIQRWKYEAETAERNESGPALIYCTCLTSQLDKTTAQARLISFA